MKESIMNELIKHITPSSHAHLVGIGGVSMSPLAIVLHEAGINVSGSDIRDSDSVISMRHMGMDIKIGHSASNIDGADYLIRTAAVHDDNPEISAAKQAGIPVFERAEAWGFLMKSYKNALCVSGTHGKTTTTSMAAHIMMSAHRDPTVMIGGVLPMFGSGYNIGKGDTIILESCEYYDSFLSFSPTVAVILNIEADHLDYFKTLDNIKKSFRTFAELVPEDTGCVVANADDENTMSVLSGLKRKLITFGFSENADVTAKNIVMTSKSSEFDIYKDGEMLVHIDLNVPGRHNILDALAASAAALCLGASKDDIKNGLSSFRSAERRFEYKGTYNGADIFDDYAHHPGELKVLLDMVSELDYKRVIVAFQPHTYSRTEALFDDFVMQLRRPDIAVLMEIYPAREENVHNTSSKDLCDLIDGSVFCKTLIDVEDTLKKLASPGDIIITVGAGELNTVSDAMTK